jgi:hypothetical protein
MSTKLNASGQAGSLVVLSPIRNSFEDGIAFSDRIRNQLTRWTMKVPNSPMAEVPDTYFCRYFVLDDVYIQSLPGNDLFGTLADFVSIGSDKARIDALPKADHLQSKYLVFYCNYYGDLDRYLRGMWNAIDKDLSAIWKYCYGFDKVTGPGEFAAYMRKCKLDMSLSFVGSNGDPLVEQLKALYLKQQLTEFAMRTQGMPAAELQQEYQSFIRLVQPMNVAQPTWTPGKYKHSNDIGAAA